MMEGEMFSSKGAMTARESIIVLNKEICQTNRVSEVPSNYNSSRYKTPLK